METLISHSPFGFVVAQQLGHPHGGFVSKGDEWFAEALKEARLGVGRTHPNPPVGCVVVNEGQIVGRGFHAFAGAPHAEVNALRDAGVQAEGATLYVTLEPCHHHGRTPPCTEAIIKSKVKRVVIGVQDPNPIVDGNGISALMQAGIEVTLREADGLGLQARALIMPFAKMVKKRLPWVICKVATSLDGRVSSECGLRTSISHEKAWQLVHHLRDSVDAVAVGSRTVEVDDPQLTVRGLAKNEVRNPIRIVFDGHLKTAVDRMVYRSGYGRVVIIHTDLASPERVRAFDDAGIERLQVPAKDGHVSLLDAFKAIAELGVMSVLVECGGKLLTQLLQDGLYDELWWVVSPTIFGRGPCAVDGMFSVREGEHTRWLDAISLGQDTLFIGQNRN